MRYWWVNQNQTFRQEIEGGYLWSPKRNKNGHRNPFYEFMREVRQRLHFFRGLRTTDRVTGCRSEVIGMGGFKSFGSAAITLAGAELAHRIRKRRFSLGRGRYRNVGR